METPNDIAKKYVYGNHDALTDKQEVIDMAADIQEYANDYHQVKLNLLRKALLADIKLACDGTFSDDMEHWDIVIPAHELIANLSKTINQNK